MNKIEISLQDLFESDVSLETVGLKTGISSVLLDEYRRGLKSWRKMPLDVALRLTDYWNSREDVLSKYQRVILMNQLTLIQAFRKMCPDAKCDYYDDSGIESALGVLDSGLEGMYDDVYGLSDSVSESVSGFIIDVLSMYNDVGWRYGNLSEIQKENLNPSWIVFGGFSREFERRHYEACNSIVNRLDMFPTVSYRTDEAGNRNILSETEMIGYYRRLLRNYECGLKNIDDSSNDVTFSALRRMFER